jgi:hypothetical protein
MPGIAVEQGPHSNFLEEHESPHKHSGRGMDGSESEFSLGFVFGSPRRDNEKSRTGGGRKTDDRHNSQNKTNRPMQRLQPGNTSFMAKRKRKTGQMAALSELCT